MITAVNRSPANPARSAAIPRSSRRVLRGSQHPAAMKHQPRRRPQGLDAVDGRGLEPDRRRLVEVPRSRRDLDDPEAEVGGLHQQLRVEAEVDRAAQERHARSAPGRRRGSRCADRSTGSRAPGSRSWSGSGWRSACRAASRPRGPCPAPSSSSEHEIGLAMGDRRDQLGISSGSYWPSGWKADHDLGPPLQRLQVTGLLVAAVPDVVRVPDHVDAELAGDRQRLVGGAVARPG